MSNYLKNNPNFILYLITFSMIGMLFIVIISLVNKKYYAMVVDLYIKKYNRLPIMAGLAKEASLILTPVIPCKSWFIMDSLILPYNKFSNHDMTIEQYNYINSLPMKLTIGFRIEGFLWIISIPPMLIGFILHALFE